MARSAHFPVETRTMIDFQKRNERYGGLFRYLGRRAIFPTQTLRPAVIWIFLNYTNFRRLSTEKRIEKPDALYTESA